MTQDERRRFLLAALLRERTPSRAPALPPDADGQRLLLRALLNLRPPAPVGQTFLRVQDAYLQEELRRRGITDAADLRPVRPGLYLWRGELTTLRCDAIVNAANSRLLGCFCPNHGCVDNAVHTFAGVQLRLACAALMRAQGHEEEVGGAKRTPAFNLPCKSVLHTVGPQVRGRPTAADEAALAACYDACLTLADEERLKNLAFCCVSTGEYGFPSERAAEVAIRAVETYRARTRSRIEVIFNVFRETDYAVYRALLGADGAAPARAGDC